MARRRLDDFDGVEIDLPFFSLHLGPWGWEAMSDEDREYRRARRRVRARLRFYRHVATYAAIIGGLLLIDWLTGGGISRFSLWVAGIWGALIVFQGVNTFVLSHLWSRETEQRMIESELRRRGRT